MLEQWKSFHVDTTCVQPCDAHFDDSISEEVEEAEAGLESSSKEEEGDETGTVYLI